MGGAGRVGVTPSAGWHLLLNEALKRVRRRARDWWRGETDATYFDARSFTSLNDVLVGGGLEPLRADPRQAESGAAGAARFVLALLSSRGLLRRRFPRALSDGVDGAFARWLTRAAPRLGLSPRGLEHARAAFDLAAEQPLFRVLATRTDLRDLFPLMLTPRHSGRVFHWLIHHGLADFQFSAEQVLWAVYANAEDTGRALALMYLVRPDWQERLPHGLTPAGWPRLLRWVAGEYGVRGRWLGRSRRPEGSAWDEVRALRQSAPASAGPFPLAAARAGDAAAVVRWAGRAAGGPTPSAWRAKLAGEVRGGVAARPSVNVLGHFRYPSGLQEAARAIVNGLEAHGARVACRDLPLGLSTDWRDGRPLNGMELSDVTLYVAAVNSFMQKFYPQSGLKLRPGVRRIAVWYWELEQVPADWVRDARHVDEVWAPTRFIADAMRRAVDVPVFDMLPGVELPKFAPLPRSYFGLPEGKFLFAFLFDMGSVMSRKNPLALIEAYRRAFEGDPRRGLVIKVSRGRTFPENRDRLMRVAESAGVTVIDRVLTRPETLALLNACDCYASLHRSEGLGLGMAESMLMAKPTVGTGYSGNVDFMTPQTSLLVRYERVPIDEDIPPYPRGCVWAEPDVAHAAELMRWAADHPAESADLGRRARADLEARLSVPAAGRRMLRRLEQLRDTGAVELC